MPGIGLLSEIHKPPIIVSKELVFCNMDKRRIPKEKMAPADQRIVDGNPVSNVQWQ
jgi:hypothetical protein